VAWWEGMKATLESKRDKLPQGHAAILQFEQDYKVGIAGVHTRIQRWETMQGQRIESDDQLAVVLETVKTLTVA